MIPVVPQKNTLFCSVMSAAYLAQETLQLPMLHAFAYHGRRGKHPVIERQERQFRCCERQWVDDLIRIPVFEGVDVCIQCIIPRCVDPGRQSAQNYQRSIGVLLYLPNSPTDLKAIEDGKYRHNQKSERDEVVVKSYFLCEDDAAVESVCIIR